MYGISQWLLYHHIKTDPTFPCINVGARKKYLINPNQLEEWIANKSRKHQQKLHQMPSSIELLEVFK